MSDDFCWWTGYELDDTCGETCFEKDLMNEIVGVGCCWGGFPNDDIAYEGWCCGLLYQRCKGGRGGKGEPPGRFPPMAVKLKGLTAKTKPSSGRYSIRFQDPGPEKGCSS